MKRLRNLLHDSSKDRRHKNNILNIQVTILAWLLECIGFCATLLGAIILGQKNTIVTKSLQIFSHFTLFTLLPCVYLLNSSAYRFRIVESNRYQTLLKHFNCQYEPDDKEDAAIEIPPEIGDDAIQDEEDVVESKNVDEQDHSI